ncbi:ras guanine nucleotide exchange factor domain-containing protein [Powellomyces hirtus]|nr:ras guanine nucleotide exchange factor domain-containing protein [Powellomyces hirtus]
MEFVKVFLMLYRKFMRPSELLDRLMDRFDAMEDKDDETQARGGPINAVQLRVCNVLIHWCNDYWCDFHSDIMRFTMHVFLEICSSRPAYAAICQKLGSLVFREPPSDAERELSDWGLTDVMDVARSPSVSSPHSGYDDSTLEEHARSVHQRLSGSKSSEDFGGKRSGYGDAENASARSFDRRSANSNTTSMSSHSDGTEHGSIYGSNLTAAGVSFLELDNEDIAKQLNILEAEIFSRIKPRDLLQHIWSRTHKGRHAASVAASIGHFNFISSWVTTRILAQRKVKTRAQVLGKFMKIAQVLRNSNNYNTLMAVLAGINSGAILRLRQTRKFLQDRQSYRNHQALEKLMSSDKSFALYRQALRQSELPCIPYLGVFLRDLVYIDENKDKRPDGSINLPKFLLMGDVILMIQNFQQVPYDVVRNPYIATLILSQPVMSEEQSYERSLELEPRTASTSPHR